MIDVANSNSVESYKLTEYERLDMTNQLKEAMDFNKQNPQKKEWDSNEYRDKYGI